MLFNLAFPRFKNKEEICFDQIENSILSGKVDAGVVIHENRFTYQNKGLVKVIDLGEFWHQKTNLPIPLPKTKCNISNTYNFLVTQQSCISAQKK